MIEVIGIILSVVSLLFLAIGLLLFLPVKVPSESELQANGYKKARDIHGDERNHTNASSVWQKGNKIKYGNP